MLAGAIGTAAMTVSERLEMTVSVRPVTSRGRSALHLVPGVNPASAARVSQVNSPVTGHTASPWAPHGACWTSAVCAVRRRALPLRAVVDR
ncbi:MAG: hypothetical protein M3P91_07760 [Actinomycetota bacterium]|nr:hypothetical protein [Actinomycetota bacterium]